MSTQVVLTLKSGQVVKGVSYRMAPTSPATPSVPASPDPFSGGMYHVMTAQGRVNIPANEVLGASLSAGALT